MVELRIKRGTKLVWRLHCKWPKGPPDIPRGHIFYTLGLILTGLGSTLASFNTFFPEFSFVKDTIWKSVERLLGKLFRLHFIVLERYFKVFSWFLVIHPTEGVAPKLVFV